MIKYRILYTLLLAASVVFAAAYESRLTFVLLITVLLLPVVSFLILLIERLAVSFEVTPDKIFSTKLRRFSVVVKIKNRFIIPISPMKITGVFQDSEGNLIKDKLMIISVMPFSKSEFVFNGHLKYRGEYFLGLTSAELCDFLCLFRFKIKLTPTCRTVVAPRRLTIERSGSLCSDEDDSIRTETTFFENDSFSSVREYMDGEPLRKVHWKLSAKQDKLMVKQSDRNLSSSAAVIIDASTSKAGTTEGECEVDAVLEASLAIIRKIIGEGSTAACVFRGKNGETEIIAAETAEDYEYLYYRFSVIPVEEKTEGTEELMKKASAVLRNNEQTFIIAPELNAEEFKSILSSDLEHSRSISIFTLSKTTDEEFSALVNEDSRVKISVIDTENIAGSLEEALFDNHQ